MPADLQNNHHKPNSSQDRVTIYAAASTGIDPHFHEPVRQLGQLLAQARVDIVYGGGGTGLMGTLADSALEHGGQIYGVIPEFMQIREVAHRNLTELQVVPDMRVRKERMLQNSLAVITLPGGMGTLEELFEVITLKRLGYYPGEIILLNTNNYYDKLLDFLDHAGQQRFIMPKAGFLAECWQVADTPEQAVDLIRCSHDY